MKRHAVASTLNELPLVSSEQELVESIKYITTVFLLGICDPGAYDPNLRQARAIHAILDRHLPAPSETPFCAAIADQTIQGLKQPGLVEKLAGLGKGRECLEQHFRMLNAHIRMALKERQQLGHLNLAA